MWSKQVDTPLGQYVSDDLARVAIASVRIRRLHFQIIFPVSSPRQVSLQCEKIPC